MEAREMFLEDLARSLDYWIQESVSVLTQADADLAWTDAPESFNRLQKAIRENGLEVRDVEQIVSEVLRGFAVSILTTVDGGTALAERLRLAIVDDNGRSLGDELHDDFVVHLVETGRMS